MNGLRSDARRMEAVSDQKETPLAGRMQNTSRRVIKDFVSGPLARACSFRFSDTDWKRGEDYARRGRVKFYSTTGNALQAYVQGSEPNPYVVAILLNDLNGVEALNVSCSCPRFEDFGICKHLAATIIKADQQGVTASWKLDSLLDLNDIDEVDWDEAAEVLYAKPRTSTRGRAPSPNPSSNTTAAKRSPSNWQQQLARIASARSTFGPDYKPPTVSRRKLRRLLYVVDSSRSLREGRIALTFMSQEQLKSGDWGTSRRVRLTLDELFSAFTDEDSALIGRLVGNELKDDHYSLGVSAYSRVSQCLLSPAIAAEQISQICATGRCMIAPSTDVVVPALLPAVWDDGPPWQFELNWQRDPKRAVLAPSGQFRRTGMRGDAELLPLAETIAAFSYGVLMGKDRFARMIPISTEALAWITYLRHGGILEVPEKDLHEFAAKFYTSSLAPEIDLPEEIRWPVIQAVPQPCARICKPKVHYRDDLLAVNVSFLYDGSEVTRDNPGTRIADEAGRRLIARDVAEESRRFAELRQCGFTQPDGYIRSQGDLQLALKKLSTSVEELSRLGWLVEAEGQLIRRPGKFNISVTSGVDWFDLSVECDFDGIKAALPDLLRAIEKGEHFITLGDGTRGMLPEEWLKKYAPIAELGNAEGDSLRFLPSQAMILDALLAAQPDVNVDATFRRVREKLRSFDGVKPRQESASFQGILREYQREGLGWLDFLREFGFGGCLADDMGLGKTIQVLALLEGIRTSRAKKNTDVGPSLVVAPKSLIFNWVDEAARFTPQMKVLNYTGTDRKSASDAMADFDLVVTTYGTLRKDIVEISKVPFHYAILDEAQAIKNPASQSAKACRLLQAQHRLVMTGTPVENHLGDLWSLFEFLNPGMLGRSKQFAMFAGRTKPDAEAVELLARALRPFLLRRTKEQVLKELPRKTEQTLYCEMEPKQRKLYNELRDHYRALLAKKIESVGLAKSKIQILEALLRLRQAACHPALVDKKKTSLPSAKLDALLEQLTEVIEERHKVLVFSQFTSLLNLVKPKLEERGILYEYLDGSTRDRKSPVMRFQTDENCRVFLISLKAGGHGLNLTAADYVFILDPWWNPAVEMQAVDRAHRIGQERPVFAYRLIARDTVEEKILELQKQKRTLAEAVITADENLLRTLTADDLQMLLS